MFLFVFLFFSGALYAQPALNPKMEGIYSLHLVCAPHDSSCDTQRMANVDRLSIVDSRLNTGVWITVASKHRHDFVDRFFDAEVSGDGSRVTATPSSRLGTPGAFSYVEIVFDSQTGHVRGKMVHTATLAEYRFDAEPLRTVAQFFQSTPPSLIGADSIEGRYRGSIGRYPGTLLVRQLDNDTLVGHFQSDALADRIPVLLLDFSSGQWSPEIGLLQLTFTAPRLQGQGELALAYRSGGGRQPQLVGFEFSGFADNSAGLAKVN